MQVIIAHDDGTVFGKFTMEETYSTMKAEMDIDKQYEPTKEEVFEYMMEEVMYDAEVFFKAGK